MSKFNYSKFLGGLNIISQEESMSKLLDFDETPSYTKIGIVKTGNVYIVDKNGNVDFINAKLPGFIGVHIDSIIFDLVAAGFED